MAARKSSASATITAPVATPVAAKKENQSRVGGTVTWVGKTETLSVKTGKNAGGTFQVTRFLLVTKCPATGAEVTYKCSAMGDLAHKAATMTPGWGYLITGDYALESFTKKVDGTPGTAHALKASFIN